MIVKATYLLGQEDKPELLEKTASGLQKCIESNPDSLVLTTDDDKLIGHSIKAYVEEDHIAVEYECKEEYREVLTKEGFICLD